MNDEIGDSVREYFEFLFDKLNELVIEDISYSDYDQMTDWVGEIRNHVRRIEKKQAQTKPIHKEKNLYCPNCDHWLLWDDAIPNEEDSHCGVCGQRIDWTEDEA